MYRQIVLSEVVRKVKEMIISSSYYINRDISDSLYSSLKTEESEIGKGILEQLIRNSEIAAEKQMPICQDTGMAFFFIELGQYVQIINDMKENKNIISGTLTEGINEAVRQAYEEGYLRKSVVKDPFFRENTGDNTPAIIHYEIVEGDQIHIDFSPKGFGSENMSRIYMLAPSDGIEGAKRVILETIDKAGSNACPPMIIGVGIGGSFDKAAVLAKKALFRPIDLRSEIPYVRELEEELLQKANALGIGPQGLGGTTSVLGINILTHPTHIAGLPVAINVSCHATRHGQLII